MSMLDGVLCAALVHLDDLGECADHRRRGERRAAPHRPPGEVVDVGYRIGDEGLVATVEVVEELADEVLAGRARVDPGPVVRERGGCATSKGGDRQHLRHRRRKLLAAHTIVARCSDDHRSFGDERPDPECDHRRLDVTVVEPAEGEVQDQSTSCRAPRRTRAAAQRRCQPRRHRRHCGSRLRT